MEPVTFTDEQLTIGAQQISQAVLTSYTAKGMSAGDIATMMAVAAAEVHCQCHGAAGLEHLRTAIDVCEAQLMGSIQ